MKKQKIKVGYEIKKGNEVTINLAHTVITGLTQESGKTTLIMGLIKRSGLRAIIIKTKIGEKSITEGSIIPPFYKEDFDWEYASELLESSRKEKLKFERSWIIKYSKSANNLLEFKKNIDDALAKEKIRELEKSVLITLQAYLEKVLPELQYAPLSKTLDIKEGINIMDLERFKEETQSLIIRSVLTEVLTKEKNTIVIIPEAWQYIPERIANPVKRAAEGLVRKGAANNNYLWLDSQDITGISKVILKQVSNWILGYQSEINEIKRTLDQIPLPKRSKPKPEDISTLELGHFFVATRDFTKKTYAQPSWLDDKTAKSVSIGKIKVEGIEKPTHIAPFKIVAKEQPVATDETYQPSLDAKKIISELRDDFISNRNDFFTKFEQFNDTIANIQSEIFKLKQQSEIKVDEDEIIMRVLQKMPTNNVGTTAPINKQEIIDEILSKMPKSIGTTNYKVAPLEKIKKGFLEEAKNKILSDIESLSDDSKKMLKYLESKGKGAKSNEIITKCYLIKDGSSQRKKVSNASLQLRGIEVIQKDTAGLHYGKLNDRIKDLMGTHKATDQEIDQVYNHILVDMLNSPKNE